MKKKYIILTFFTLTSVLIFFSCEKDKRIENVSNNNDIELIQSQEKASTYWANGWIYCYDWSCTCWVVCGSYMRTYYSWFGFCASPAKNCLPSHVIIADNYVLSDLNDTIWLTPSVKTDINDFKRKYNNAVNNGVDSVLSFYFDNGGENWINLSTTIKDDLSDTIITFKEFHDQLFIVNVEADTCTDVYNYNWDF